MEFASYQPNYASEVASITYNTAEALNADEKAIECSLGCPGGTAVQHLEQAVCQCTCLSARFDASKGWLSTFGGLLSSLRLSFLVKHHFRVLTQACLSCLLLWSPFGGSCLLGSAILGALPLLWGCAKRYIQILQSLSLMPFVPLLGLIL